MQGAQGAQGANVFELLMKKKYQMSFGGDYGEDTGDYMHAAKDAIATMAAALPEITIHDEENEFDSKEFKGEYEKIYRDVVEYTTHTCC